MNSELSMDRVLIEKLTNILEVNLDREHFGVKELAKEAGLSRSKLHRALKSLEGKSSSKFICEFRLKKAMVMLQNNVATASEIAYRVGFSSPTYFNTCFHDYYGYPPGEVKFRNPIVEENIVDTKNVELTEASLIANEIKPSKKGRLRKRMVFINTFVIVLLSVVIYNLYQKYQNSIPLEISNTKNNEKSIAMLHFKNLSTDIENQYFVDGMMDDILNHLSGVKGLVVKSAQSSEKYSESNKTARQIGEELGVDYLLDGSIQKYGDSVRIITHLINAKEDRQLSSIVFDWEFKNIFTLQNKIAHEIANELNITLSPTELQQIEKKPTVNLEAYNMYLKGRFFWHRRTKEDLIKSIEYFEKAIELDPDYAVAYSGLADSYYILGYWKWMPTEEGYKKGLKYAQKALSMDNSIAEAHTTLGAIYLFQDDRDLVASEAEFKKALSLNPNYATGHHFYADLLEVLGKRKEAIKHINLALQLNPNSYMMNYNGAQYYFRDKRFEEALEHAKRAQEIGNNRQDLQILLFSIYSELGKYNLATVEMQKYYKLDPNTAEAANEVGEAFNKSGIEGVYRVMIDVDFKSGYADKYPYSQALQYAFINDLEKAFKWLEMAYKGDEASIRNAIKTDFRFKKLQNYPKYLELLVKIKLADQYE